MTEQLAHEGSVMFMPAARRKRLWLACRTFWRIAHGQPAGAVMIDGPLSTTVEMHGPVVLGPRLPCEGANIDIGGMTGGDVTAAWHVAFDGKRWVRT